MVGDEKFFAVRRADLDQIRGAGIGPEERVSAIGVDGLRIIP